MKIKINGKEIEIDDSTRLVIEFVGDLELLTTETDPEIVNASNVGNISTSGGSIGNIIVGNNNVRLVNGGLLSARPYSIEISVVGDVSNVETVSGNVSIHNKVKGNVKTVSGNVSVAGGCENVKTVSGDVDVAGNVFGDIDTISGDIR